MLSRPHLPRAAAPLNPAIRFIPRCIQTDTHHIMSFLMGSKSWRAGWWSHCEKGVLQAVVIPAKAGIHSANPWKCASLGLDSRFRGNDQWLGWIPISNGTSTAGCAIEPTAAGAPGSLSIWIRLSFRARLQTSFSRPEETYGCQLPQVGLCSAAVHGTQQRCS